MICANKTSLWILTNASTNQQNDKDGDSKCEWSEEEEEEALTMYTNDTFTQ